MMFQKKDTSITLLALLVALATAPKTLAASVASHLVLAQSPPTSFPLPSSVPSGTTLKVDGSDSMSIVNQTLKRGFEQQFPNTGVEVQADGTETALQALADGQIDLAAIGRLLTESEQSQGLVATPLSREKIAIVVGANNPFTRSVTGEQFAKIFRGEITDWAEVGGSPGKIRLIDRPDRSDTRQALQNYPVFKTAPFTAGATAQKLDQDSTAGMIEALGQDGIGYAIVSQVVDQDNVRVLPMHNTLPTDPRYPFSQPRVYVYKAAPIPAVAAFLGYATSPAGQQLVAEATDAAAGIASTVAGGDSPAPSVDTAADGATSPVPADANAVSADDPTATAPTNTALAPNPNNSVDVAETGTSWWWLLPLALLAGLLAWWLSRRRSEPEVSSDEPAVDPNATRLQTPQPIDSTPNSPPVAAPSPVAPVTPAILDPTIATTDSLPGEAAGIVTASGAAAGAAAWAALPDEFPTAASETLADELAVEEPPAEALAAPSNPAASSSADLENGAIAETTLAARTESIIASDRAAIGGDSRPLADAAAAEPGISADAPPSIALAAGAALAGGIAASMSQPTDQPEVLIEPALAPSEMPEDPTEAAAIPLDSTASLDDTESIDSVSVVEVVEVTDETIWVDGTPVAEVVEVTTETIWIDMIPALVEDQPNTASGAIDEAASDPDLLGAAAVAAAGMASGAILTVNISDLSEPNETEPVPLETPPIDGTEILAQSDVTATKFDVGQNDLTAEELASVDEGLADLPDGYGDSRIVLMPRDPQWAYTYWDIPNDHKHELRRQGGIRLALRLYDVTDVDLDAQRPHSLQQYDCDEMARDWYLPIPVSDRDYVTEIGYVTAEGHWLMLARSAPVRIPPTYPSDWFDEQFVSLAWEDDLRGKTFLELVPPWQESPLAADDVIYDEIFELAQSTEAQRVAGSLYSSMQQVPSESVSSFVLPSGAGIWAGAAAMGMPGVAGMSGIGMSGIGMSGIGGASMPSIRPRKFWLVADAELIVYGATEPDATVTIGGRPVSLNPDGTFRFQMSFQDGLIDYPILAVAVDGEQARSIHMSFRRETPERNTNTKDEATDEWMI